MTDPTPGPLLTPRQPASRHLPARDRPSRQAWLGVWALCLGVLSWIMPVLGAPLALGGLLCGVVSMTTDRRYRIDWMAAVGAGLGSAQILLSVLLLLASWN